MKLDRRGRLALTERQIEQQIVDILTAHGWRVLRTNVFAGAVIQRQGSIEPGIPDLQARRRVNLTILVNTWEIIWIEVKRPGEKLSPVQVAWHAAAKKRGETVFVFESVEDAAREFGIRL